MIRAISVVALVLCTALQPSAGGSASPQGELKAAEPSELLPGAMRALKRTCHDIDDFWTYYTKFDLENVAGSSLPWIEFKTDPRRPEGPRAATYSCRAVFQQKEETTSEWPPPNVEQLRASRPDYLRNVTYGGRIHVTTFYRAKRHNKAAAVHWSAAEVDKLASEPSSCGFYKSDVCERAFSKHAEAIAGRRGLVMGSLHPWAEAAVLRHGATHVSTVEYLPLTTDHAQLDTMTPADAAKRFLNGTLLENSAPSPAGNQGKNAKQLFDFIVSFSSLEHDGLGRYGDPLNAHGDLMSLAKARCLLHPAGTLFLGLPVGPDNIQFNAHRVYGYLQLSAVLALGFEVQDVLASRGHNFTIQKGRPKSWGDFQPILVLRKRNDL